MKNIVVPLLLLVSFSSILLISHWQHYSKSNEQISKNIPELHIVLKAQKEALFVKHTYKKLSPGTYTILPKDGTERLSCELSNGSCEISQINNTFRITLARQQTVIIKYKHGNIDNQMWKDWKLHLKKEGQRIQPEYDVVFEDYKTINRTWIGLTNKTSDIKKDLVRYYSFEPTITAQFPLVQLNQNRVVWEVGNWNVTYNKNQSLSKDLKERVAMLAHMYSPAIVELDQQRTTIDGSYISIKKRNIRNLESKLFKQHLTSIGSKKEQWVISALTRAIFQSESHSEQSTFLSREIQQSFTAEQLNKIKLKLLQLDHKESLVKEADNAFSKIYGRETNFFQQNSLSKELIPLYFTYKEPVYWEADLLAFKMIEHKGKTYLPLSPLVEEAEYSMTKLNSNQAFRVTIPERTYLFYLNQPTFIVNEQEFGIAPNLLRSIDGTIYIKKSGIEDLLHISIEKKKKKIALHRKAQTP